MKKQENKNFYKRKELSYTPYISGAKNEHGDTVIRPLTHEEKEYLEKFNNEFVSGKFDEGALHEEMILSNKDKIKKLKKELQRLDIKLNKLTVNTGYRSLKADEKIKYRENKESRDVKIGDIQKRRREISDEIYELDVKKQADSGNYSSRMDTMSHSSFRDFEFDYDKQIRYGEVDIDVENDFHPDIEEKELYLEKSHFINREDDT